VADTFQIKPLLNEQVTRQAIMKNVSGKKFLHLACHGSFNWENVMESALFLTNDEPLTLNDILSPQFDLEAMRLVTLSACETGITELNQLPDEFIGLPAGFMQAGTPGIISTLWPVDDNSTALLMLCFYDFCLKMPPATALKEAQAWLRQSYPMYDDPYFWAAFTFYGA
jgi:CHAT domain-containing protein